MIDADAVNRVLFHPRREAHGASPTGMPTITQCKDAQISGYLHSQPGSPNLLLFFHGNGEIADDYDAIASLYTGCGASFWVVDYRGYGKSTGAPSFSKMLQDAEVMLHDVPRVASLAKLDITTVIVMGRSLGSASAIHLASTYPNRLAALILDSPYADLSKLIRRLGGPSLSEKALQGFRDNLDKMGSCEVPTLIVHGTEDRIIPFSEAVALHRASKSAVKRLVAIEGAGHNTLLRVGYRQVAAEVREHISRVASLPRPLEPGE